MQTNDDLSKIRLKVGGICLKFMISEGPNIERTFWCDFSEFIFSKDGRPNLGNDYETDQQKLNEALEELESYKAIINSVNNKLPVSSDALTEFESDVTEISDHINVLLRVSDIKTYT